MKTAIALFVIMIAASGVTLGGPPESRVILPEMYIVGLQIQRGVRVSEGALNNSTMNAPPAPSSDKSLPGEPFYHAMRQATDNALESGRIDVALKSMYLVAKRGFLADFLFASKYFAVLYERHGLRLFDFSEAGLLSIELSAVNHYWNNEFMSLSSVQPIFKFQVDLIGSRIEGLYRRPNLESFLEGLSELQAYVIKQAEGNPQLLEFYNRIPDPSAIAKVMYKNQKIFAQAEAAQVNE